ncbi:hypothetical protein AB4K20DRAFT_1895431 [Rhizopus microsporus]
MEKSIIKNPFTYKTYSRTPSTSPTLYPSNTVTSDKISDFSNSNNNNSDDSDSSTDDSIVYNLQSLLSITKPMFFKNVENKDIFDYTFYTR